MYLHGKEREQDRDGGRQYKQLWERTAWLEIGKQRIDVDLLEDMQEISMLHNIEDMESGIGQDGRSRREDDIITTIKETWDIPTICIGFINKHKINTLLVNFCALYWSMRFHQKWDHSITMDHLGPTHTLWDRFIWINQFKKKCMKISRRYFLWSKKAGCVS